MRYSEKIATVEKMTAMFQQVPHFVVATFNGLTVNQANELRRRIGDAGGHYAVIKNRLAKRAAAGTAAEPLAAHFEGPCALARHDTDPVALAKALADFAKANPQIQMLAGLVDAKQTLVESEIKALSALPGLPELQAQLLALIQTPATMLVRLVGTPGTQLARAIDARREKLETEA